jgi:hypothetical protein
MSWDKAGGQEHKVSGYTVGILERVEWEENVYLLTMENAIKEKQHKRLYPTDKAAKMAFDKIAKEWQ